MSVEQWKAEATELGMTNKEIKEYVMRQMQKQEREAEYQREREREAHSLETQRLAAERER